MKKFHLVLIVFLSILSSCSTYYLTSQSLKEQLQNIDPNKINDAYDFRLGLLGVALKGGKNFYNGIETIKCKDKNGKDMLFKVQSQTGIRLTDSSGKRIQLYFDSIFLRFLIPYSDNDKLLFKASSRR